MKTWNQRLKESYEKKFKSVMDFARDSGVSKDSIHKYLKNGVRQPRGNTLVLLAKSLGVDILWLKEGVVNKQDTAPMPPDILQEIVKITLKDRPSKWDESDIAAVVSKVYQDLYGDPHLSVDMVRGYMKHMLVE